MRQQTPFPIVPRGPWIIGILVITLALGLPLQASADLILNAELLVTAQDNIVGLLSGGGDAAGTGTMGGMQAASVLQAISGPGTGRGFGGGSGTGTADGSGKYLGAGSLSPSDLSVTLRAELGGFVDAGDSLSFFGKGFAERTNYQEYTVYDQSVAGVSAGMAAYLGYHFSARITGFTEIRRYDNDPDRDSTILGGVISLKQFLGRSFSLRESAGYDASSATYEEFSYRGPTYGLKAGYDATEELYLTTGYRFQSRRYQDVSRTVLRARTASLGGDYTLGRHWSTGLLYERETSIAGSSGVITRNNIGSCSLRYSY